MLVLGHLGTALTAAGYADRKADLRWVIFLTLLADIVDKPLGLVLLKDTVNSGRIYFHSLLVNLLLTFILVVARRPLVYPLALWVHQFCDRMWLSPTTALWPFGGSFVYRPLPLEDWVYSLLSPYNAFSETVGLLLLVAFAWRERLLSLRRVREWLRHGRLAPPVVEEKARVW
jgi:hypothetical protein